MAKTVNPNPFKTEADLASWEKDLATADAALDRMVAATRASAAQRGQANGVVSTQLAVEMMSPVMMAGLLTAAVARLAFPPEELPEP